jgi:opacity protein-like surface antigen
VLFGSLALIGAVHAADVETEDWTARFQTTYVWQNKPSFRAAYSGQNSLSAQTEKSYTATATAYLGLRTWQGGELYFNPGVTQGRPFSNLEGSAGFSNGELTRTAGSRPKLYRQRLFLRQTWGLDGGTE